MWDSLKDDKGCVNSAYGNLIFNEINKFGYSEYLWALQSLESDPDTRQAIMHFNKPHHQYTGNKDFVCTIGTIFQIRNGKLNLTVDMRSNDIILGLATDVAFFTLLQQQMLYDLKCYGNINDIDVLTNLELGTYTHIDHSLHLYERHFILAEEMLKNNFENIEMPILDNPLICFDDLKIIPYITVERLIHCIVKDTMLTNTDVKLLNCSNFYKTVASWLDIK